MFPAFGLALLVSLALSATAAVGTASAATQHWYGLGAGKKLLDGTAAEVEGNGWNFKLSWTLSGIKEAYSCTLMSTGGAIENPSNGAAGTLGKAPFSLSECAATEPTAQHCSIPTTIQFETLKAQAIVQKGVPAIQYTPESGGKLTTFSVTNCATPSFNGPRELTGSITAVALLNQPGVYEFNATSGSALKYLGQNASITGNFELESKAEELVAIGVDSATPHWYLGGFPGEGPNTKFAEATPTGYHSSTGSMDFTVAANLGGIQMSIHCSGAETKAGGVVENPTGGGSGTATGTFSFGGCALEPAKYNCSVSPTQSGSLTGVATEAEGSPAVKFSPAESLIAAFTVKGCSAALLNGTKNLTGSLTAAPDPFGAYLFAPSGAKYAGQNATVSGRFALETEAGERIGLAP